MRGVIQVGDTVGPFTIVAKLGRGGMSTVYNAYEAGLDREVALKVLPIDLLEEPGFADRFEREARLIAKLEHPHIVPLYAYGIDDGVPWMALRLVRGGHLGERLESGSINHDAGLAYFTMIADALDHAHSLGVVHRDLKPQNVLLGEHGELYLADFGISRLLQGRTTITSTGAVLGTPQYMSPEQAQDSQVGPSADIYALGIMAYQWLTGLLPFDADTPYAVMYKHVNSPLAMEPLDGLPERARQVLARALAKQSDQRWPTAGKFIDELAGALGVEGVPGQVLSGGRLPASVAAAISARKLTKVPPAPTEHLPAGRTDTPRPLPTPQSRPVTPATVVRPPGGFEEPRTAPGTAPPPPPSPPVSPTDPKALQFRPRGAPAPKAKADPKLLGVGAGGLLVLALVGWWVLGGGREESPADPASAEVAATEATADNPASAGAAPAAEPPPLPAGDARLLLEADLACDLVINGYPRGQLQAMTPLRLELAPGRYTLSCTATEHPDVEAKQVASVVRDEPTVALFELKLQIEQREATRQAEERRRLDQEKADALARQQKEDAEAAEARRLVEEAKRREEDRIALEERKLQEARQAAERRRREETLKLDEARSAAAARRAGTTAPPPAAAAAPDPQAQARQAEARRVAEARRQAEAKRKADEEAARLAAEQAAAATAAAAAPAAPPRRLTPIAVSTPQPFYPPDALRGNVTGSVQVEITIGRDGAVKDLRILQAKPRGVFERSVQATVRNWRFQPLDEDVTIRKTIVFR